MSRLPSVRIATTSILVLVCCVLARCGGGSDGSSTGSTSPTPTPVPTPTPAPTAPSLSYASATGTTGYPDYTMTVQPSTLNANGASITGCAVKASTTALPSGLSVDPTTCTISGIPTSTQSATTYTLVATNSAGTSADATVSLTITNPAKHIMTSSDGVSYACGLSTSDGTITSCAYNTNGPLNPFGAISMNLAGTATSFISQLSTVQKCQIDLATGGWSNCSGATTSSNQAGNNIRDVSSYTIGGTLYVYTASGIQGAFGDVYLCTYDPSHGWFSTCTQNNGGIASTTWVPFGITIATVGGNPYAYVADLNGHIYVCNVSASDATLSGCMISDGGAPAGILMPFKVTIASFSGNTYAYVATNAYVLKCNVSAANGTLSACAPNNGGQSSWLPAYVTFGTVGGTTYGYVTDGNYVYVCNVNTATGAFTSCASSLGFNDYGAAFRSVVF